MPSPDKLMEIIQFQTEIAKLGLDLGGVMSMVAERTMHLVDANGAAIELVEGADMVYRATSGIAEPYLGLHLLRENSLSGLCTLTGNILRCDDSETDPRVDREACRRTGLRSMIVVPLTHKGSIVGVLKAMSILPGKFKSIDMKILGLLSELIGAAMFYATKYDIDDLFHKATHDGLTGLANRALFMDRLRQVIALSGRDNHPVGVLMIDMDGLKPVNDAFGHRVGDAVIVEFSNRLRSRARQTDTVARLGGDEFGVILLPVDGPDAVTAVMQRMNAEIDGPFDFEGNRHDIRASIGGAICPNDGSQIDQLIELADQRMYAIKRQHQQSTAEKLN